MATQYWTGATDGDYGTAGNWETIVPVATNDVRLRADSVVAITGTLDQSGVAIEDFIVEEGYSGEIGSAAAGVPTYLQIDPNLFEFAGGGVSYIDLGTASIDAKIITSTAPGTGKYGLTLIGSSINNLIVGGGSVGLATVPGSTATATTTEVTGGSVTLGEGVTATTVNVLAGSATIECAMTTINMYGGTVTTREIGAVGTFNAFGGSAFLNSVGTITTLNIYPGATVSFLGSSRARTVTTTVFNPGPSASSLSLDPAVVTQTNLPTYARPSTIRVSGT